MPRLRAFSGQTLCELLEAQGFERVRQRGSHRVMQKAVGAQTTTVVVPMHDEIRIGTLQSILRQSGLPRSMFMTENA